MMYNGTLEDIPKLYFEFDPACSENFEDSAHVYVDDIKLIGAKADIEIVDVVKLDPYEICDFERAYQQYVVNWYVYQDTPPTATIVSNKDLPEGMTASHGTRCLKIETHPRADGWQAYPRFILTRFVVQKAINALTEEEKARAYVCFDICSPYYPWTFETGFRDTVTGALTNLVYETTSFWGPNVPKSKQWTTVKYSLAEIDAEKSYSIGRSPAGGSDFTNNPESILLNWADYFGGENRVFYLDNFRIELE